MYKKITLLTIMILSICINTKPSNTLRSIFNYEYNKLFEAKPKKCKNKKILAMLADLKKDLNITDDLPIYEVENTMFTDLHRNTAAFYRPDEQSITIVTSMLYRQPRTVQKYLLCHELRHHMQFTNPAIMQEAEQYCSSLNLTIAQAIEHDADNFSINYVSQDCPYCVRDIKRNLLLTPRSSKEYKGYFTKNDFEPLLDKNIEHHYCSKHNTKFKKSLYWLGVTTYYLLRSR